MFSNFAWGPNESYIYEFSLWVEYKNYYRVLKIYFV